MIDVALTRRELRAADVAIVIDVLRATSTATQALASGYRRVLCAGSVESAMLLRRPGRVLAGEQHSVRPRGFDQGNSPSEALERRGRELVLATTNGAPTVIAAARHAPTVMLACLLNLDAVVGALLARAPTADLHVQIVCSGTDGAAALEDVYVAGRLSLALPGPRTDAALIAEAVARAYRAPLDALAASADARVLRERGLAPDIEFCACETGLDVVPTVVDASCDVAIVIRGANGTTSTRKPALDSLGTVNV